MAAIDPANEEEWRFMFDLHGVLSVRRVFAAAAAAMELDSSIFSSSSHSVGVGCPLSRADSSTEQDS
eukprot:SAG31_NODE_1256_length_9081_cov_13.160655_5_plen_67_part_00